MMSQTAPLRRTEPPAKRRNGHEMRLDWIERADGPVVALAGEYPDGHRVERHRHGRSQLLHALTGVVMVSTDEGRWMVPPEHAMWIPAGVDHSVDMLGSVSMRSVYIAPDALDGLPTDLRVVGLTGLMRSMILEVVALPPDAEPSDRAGLLRQLIVHEILELPEKPLALPFPADRRLAVLCRRFLATPSPHATIDDWANDAGMSRRSFTRLFLRETGLSLSTWRRQATLFSALPRLAGGEAVTIVALDLGYDSVAAFTTMFRRMLGASPRAWLGEARVRREQDGFG